MIDVRELRVGNVVLTFGSEQMKVVEFSSKIIYGLLPRMRNGRSKVKYSDIQGIPLSPDVLTEWGFVKSNIGGYHIMIDESPYGRKSISIGRNTDNSLGHFFLCITEFPPKSEGFIGTDCIFIRRDLQYLHQLQNCIYFITGKELEAQTELTK